MAKIARTAKTGGDPRVKVFLADDHPVVREGLTELINREADLHVCGQAATPAEALKGIVEARPDVAVVDAALRGGSGLDLVKDVRIRLPRLPILVLSVHDETVYAERFLRAGACGYIMKEASPEHVISAIRCVLRGDIYLSPTMSRKLLFRLAAPPGRKADATPVESLSDREFQIFQLIGQGLSTREIAEKLHLSVKTIESYRAHLKVKLDVASANELLRFAIKWNRRQPTD